MPPTCTLILCSLGLKQHLLCQWIQTSCFLEQIMGKLEPDLEPEKLSEHGPSGLCGQNSLLRPLDI